MENVLGHEACAPLDREATSLPARLKATDEGGGLLVPARHRGVCILDGLPLDVLFEVSLVIA